MLKPSHSLTRALRHPAEAFALAVAACLVAAVIVLLLGISGWPQILDSTALPAITAWGTLITALTTGLLAFGAGLAAMGLREQLDELKRQREADARPYLQVRRAYVQPDSGDVILTLENIGRGPAIGLEAGGWFTTSPDFPDQSLASIDTSAERALTRLKQEAAHFSGRTDAIGAGREGHIALSGRMQQDPAGLRYLSFMVLDVRYKDIFGNDQQIGAGARRWVTAVEHYEPEE